MVRAKYDPAKLFTLKVKLSGGTAIMTAWDAGMMPPNHTKLDCELRWKPKGAKVSELLFPRGATWCGIPGHQTVDGDDAKECVMSLFAMKSGDTDPDYFESYTDEQMNWADTYGEELSLEAMGRYGER